RQALVYAYGGGLRPGSYRWVKETYRRRVAIESTYRALGPARIRTSKRDPPLRLLYVAGAFVPPHLWGGLHWQAVGEPARWDAARGHQPADIPGDVAVAAALGRTVPGGVRRDPREVPNVRIA